MARAIAIAAMAATPAHPRMIQIVLFCPIAVSSGAACVGSGSWVIVALMGSAVGVGVGIGVGVGFVVCVGSGVNCGSSIYSVDVHAGNCGLFSFGWWSISMLSSDNRYNGLSSITSCKFWVKSA